MTYNGEAFVAQNKGKFNISKSDFNAFDRRLMRIVMLLLMGFVVRLLDYIKSDMFNDEHQKSKIVLICFYPECVLYLNIKHNLFIIFLSLIKKTNEFKGKIICYYMEEVISIRDALRLYYGKYYVLNDYNIYCRIKSKGCHEIVPALGTCDDLQSLYLLGNSDVVDLDKNTINKMYFYEKCMIVDANCRPKIKTIRLDDDENTIAYDSWVNNDIFKKYMTNYMMIYCLNGVGLLFEFCDKIKINTYALIDDNIFVDMNSKLSDISDGYIYDSNIAHEKDVDNLKVLKKKDFCIKKYLISGDECPICYENIMTRKDAFILQCGHAFHFSCLEKNKNYSDDNYCGKCPMCRFEYNLRYGHKDSSFRYFIADDYIEPNYIDMLTDFWNMNDVIVPKLCLESNTKHYIGMKDNCEYCEDYRLNGNKENHMFWS